MKKTLFLIAAGLLILGSPVAQIYSDVAPQVTVTKDKVVVDKVASDEVIMQGVKDAFTATPGMTGTVNVKVEKGVVTLSGVVPDAKVKADFEARAKGVAGVDKVVNDIVVKPVSVEVNK